MNEECFEIIARNERAANDDALPAITNAHP